MLKIPGWAKNNIRFYKNSTHDPASALRELAWILITEATFRERRRLRNKVARSLRVGMKKEDILEIIGVVNVKMK